MKKFEFFGLVERAIVNRHWWGNDQWTLLVRTEKAIINKFYVNPYTFLKCLNASDQKELKPLLQDHQMRQLLTDLFFKAAFPTKTTAYASNIPTRHRNHYDLFKVFTIVPRKIYEIEIKYETGGYNCPKILHRYQLTAELQQRYQQLLELQFNNPVIVKNNTIVILKKV